jgi:hypothetical protein
VERYLVQLTGKFYIKSDSDPELIPGNIYACIEERFSSSDDILDLDIELYAIPPSGASD